MSWACQDSNLEPKDYESSALTIELQARIRPLIIPLLAISYSSTYLLNIQKTA